MNWFFKCSEMYKRKQGLTHHSADVLVMYGLLYKQTTCSNAVLTFVKVDRAHALTRKHRMTMH